MTITPARRVVQQVPLPGLWTDAGPLAATRLGDLGRASLAARLGAGPVRFVIADVGRPLRWIDEADRFRFWKEEVAPRLVAPDASAITPDAYAGGVAYRAIGWQTADGALVVELIAYH